MRKLALIALLPFQIGATAPFILTEADAGEADAQINISKCRINKSQYTRYFWNRATSTGEGYLIDPFFVEFSIVRDGDRKVHATASNPFVPFHEDRIVAFGSYSLETGQTDVRCLRHSPEENRDVGR